MEIVALDPVIAEKILKIINKKLMENGNFPAKAEDSLNQLGVNSILFINIIVDIENVFGFEFENDVLVQTAFPKIQTMIDYVEAKLSASSRSTK
jgi:acyl carrier protein